MKKISVSDNTIFKISKNVGLPINLENTHPDFIPSSQNYENNKRLLEQIGFALNKRLPVLLVGETGTGKTSLVRYLANKTNNCFRRVNHNGGTTVDDIVGKILINKEGTFWVDGVLIEAMKNGWWYLADEINAASPEINFIYHCLLDDDGYIVLPENKGEIIHPHKNFRFFGAMNPSADYAGTKEINKALLSRFLVMKTDFPAPKLESKILHTRTGVKLEVADKMVKFASEIRALHSKGNASFVLSTRDLIMWSAMYQVYEKYLVSAEVTVLNKVSADDFNVVKDLMSLHFNALDNPKAKVEPIKTTGAEESPIF
jgi:midasin (ATPase involved in ribosome maturation)